MTLDERLQQIKERCDAATEGPWDSVISSYCILDGKADQLMVFDENNKHFIAHARTDVPMLLEMVDWLIKYNSMSKDSYAVIQLEKIAEKYK